ncbi:MAG: hypothetical protein DCC75_11470 [Proteobacteria bacterium]|nr:MAG: hypothetical protein DCC75_11470 [Pseudomonadota bacterium]
MTEVLLEKANLAPATGLSPDSPRAPQSAVNPHEIFQRNGAAPSVKAVSPGVSERSLDVPTNLHTDLSRSQLGDILSDRNFKNLGISNQNKFLQVLSATLAANSDHHTVEIYNEFLKLLDRQVKGEQLLFQKDRDTTAQTVLDHLHILATHPEEKLDSALILNRGEILRSMIEEINCADTEMNQGKVYATCTQTTAFTQLARSNPAEYARLIQEIVTQGQARLVEEDPETGERRLSTELALPYTSSALLQEALNERSVTESLLQNGVNLMVGAYQDGLYQGQVETIYEAIFGLPFERLDNKGERAIDPDKIVDELRRVTTDGCGKNMVSLVTDMKGKHANHALEVLAIEGNQVLLRNPWGKEFLDAAALNGRIVDAERSIYSMSLDEFKQRLNYAMLTSADASSRFGLTPGWDDPVYGPTVFFEGTKQESKKTERREEAPKGSKSQQFRTHRYDPEGPATIERDNGGELVRDRMIGRRPPKRRGLFDDL